MVVAAAVVESMNIPPPPTIISFGLCISGVDGLASRFNGLAKLVDGLCKLDRTLPQPGLDSDAFNDSASSSSGVLASSTLPQLPKLSSET